MTCQELPQGFTFEQFEQREQERRALLERTFWLYGTDNKSLFNPHHCNPSMKGNGHRIDGELLTNWDVSEPDILYPGRVAVHTFRAVFRKEMGSFHEIGYEIQKLLKCWVCGEYEWVAVMPVMPAYRFDHRYLTYLDPFSGWRESSLLFLQGAYFCPAHSFYVAHYDDKLRLAVRHSMQQLAWLRDVEVQRELFEQVYGKPLPSSRFPCKASHKRSNAMLVVLTVSQGIGVSILAFSVWSTGELSFPFSDRVFLFDLMGRMMAFVVGVSTMFGIFVVVANARLFRRSCLTKRKDNSHP